MTYLKGSEGRWGGSEREKGEGGRERERHLKGSEGRWGGSERENGGGREGGREREKEGERERFIHCFSSCIGNSNMKI